MYKASTLSKILIINLVLAAFYLLLQSTTPNYIVILLYFFANESAFFMLCVLTNTAIGKKNKRFLFAGITAGSCLLTAVAISSNILPLYFLAADCFWILGVLSARKLINITARMLYRKLGKSIRIAVIGHNYIAEQLAVQLKKKAKYTFEGFFYDEETESALTEFSNEKSIDYYLNLARQKKVTDLYITSPISNNKDLNAIVQKAESYCIRVSLVDSGENKDSNVYKSHSISGIPMLRRYSEPLRHLGNKIIKRSFDICISSVVMIFVLSWLIPLVGLLIKLESKGPVLFKQLRSGRDNNSFFCYKFRSMKINNDSDVKQASKKDNRITRIGAFLRKTSIDELPQFINVFKGDMSIVGPRPHMLSHTLEYSKQVNNYMVRLYLKPGITGWAQAKGYRGEITNITLMKKRVEHDIWYLEHWNIWLDIKILWLTFITIIIGKGNAY